MKKCRIIKIILTIILLVLVFNLLKDKFTKGDYGINYDTKAMQEEQKLIEHEKQEIKLKQKEADVKQTILDMESDKSEKYIESLNSEVEYILLTENGTNSISHSKTNSNSSWFKRTFKKSTIKINYEYSAIYSIKTSDILITNDNGKCNITYNVDSIGVKSIDITNITSTTDKSWLGKKYSQSDSLNLLEVSKDDLAQQLSESIQNKKKASENLDKYLNMLAQKFNLSNLTINNKNELTHSYEFIYNGDVKKNHPNEYLDSIDYLVIHSTAMKNMTAKQFYDNFSMYEQKRKGMAHFYIDDTTCYQLLSTNKVSWNCGTKNPLIDCTNYNSISIEICEFDDIERQKKAIENCEDFVKNIILAEYPSIHIVSHREVTGKTECPSILSNKYMETNFESLDIYN